MSAPAKAKLPLGELLVSKGVISADQLQIALREQRNTGLPLGKQLVGLGFLSEATLREALSENLGQESVDLAKVVVDSAAIKLVPKDLAKRFTLVPIGFSRENGALRLAMSNPNNLVALDQIRLLTRDAMPIEAALAAESDVLRAIEQYYGYELSIDGILREIETGEVDYSSLANAGDEYSQPVVRLIDALLGDAVQKGASDIHFEPEQSFLRIRYRIDGVLRQVRSLHRTYWPAMAVRLKVMSGMNIAESRAPQDGRISLTLLGRPLDFRVASQPTIHGENIVLRILDRLKGLVPIDELGLLPDSLSLLKLMIARPEGIILVTGPTGSGKTTTLYSILNYINAESVNIMTLEDPVEYPMPMIRQTNVSEAAKMDFASGVRSMMRQDPDVILVGEVRDQDTAEMAFRAAMTGHQVYSTLHTNSAIGAIPRLLDIGVLPDVMAGNIIGMVAQRLVRKLCMACREAYDPDPFERMLLGVKAEQPAPLVYRATGCPHCEHHGYKGRLAVLEILKMDADLDELIARRATTREIRNMAIKKGFRPLADDAIRRVLEGMTSLDEISRVVDLTDRVTGLALTM
ncbi:type II secretory ATPase GspE/PulE/Tfp pilus assembly ATPase PilB-like protein [Chitinivorax tropicus]|uniref:Type II secretory ATPase GspE/PulE/Tfp pilus assembly ATPase PilB-like protein n=1 Tax=Chitinivorax tropicus TaxID=714531 RepID=A0A840MQV6_9PROT|nr:ATPase, T2SS/T4P/T4SS family [Chitinivorax tropicus]MBB5019477.1 type II secretory ATPase GspE/PulE/Tfp pilus assembly ATPase PilB-like protein [Chitinivorax tropicus]